LNKEKNLEDLRLRRNGEGYWDPTAYEAIKRADAELEGKKTDKKKRPKRTVYNGPYEPQRGMSIKQYRKWKLKVLEELGMPVTDAEKAYIESLETEYEIDAFAHRLIMKGD
jgi:hypothetical protein